MWDTNGPQAVENFSLEASKLLVGYVWPTAIRIRLSVGCEKKKMHSNCKFQRKKSFTIYLFGHMLDFFFMNLTVCLAAPGLQQLASRKIRRVSFTIFRLGAATAFLGDRKVENK